MSLKPSILVLLIALSACATTPSPNQPSPNQPSPPPTAPNTTGIRAVGDQIQVTLSGIGTQRLNASAKQSSDHNVKPLVLSSSSFTLTSGNASVTARSSTDIVSLGGARTAGFRYVSATVSFINSGNVPLTNLTFVGSALGANQTAIADLQRYPGLAAYTASETEAIATSIKPTSPVTLEPRSLQPALMPGEEDSLQVFTESELSGLSSSPLPYGFVAHSGNSRTIAVGATGAFTIAMRVPLQALSKDDPYSITVQLTAVEHSTTTVTESLEAQLPINQAAFNAAKARVGGTLRVLPGTVQPQGEAMCGVRTAGIAGSPTALLYSPVPVTIDTTTALRVITAGQTRPAGGKLVYQGSSVSYDFAEPPMVIDFDNPAAALSPSPGLIKGLPQTFPVQAVTNYKLIAIYCNVLSSNVLLQVNP